MLQLLWLGLRGPEDAKLYRRQYVLELLMALAGSLSSTTAGGSSGGRWGQLNRSSRFSAVVGLERLGGEGLDVWIGRVVAQATLLPGAAAHAVSSAGLVPWLTAVATQAISSTAGSHSCWEWPIECLLQLVSQGIGLRLRVQAVGVYEGYVLTAARLVRALLAGSGSAADQFAAPTSPGACRLQVTPRRVGSNVAARVQYRQLELVLQLLQTLVAVAPTSSSRRHLAQQLLQPAIFWELCCCCRAVASTVGGPVARGMYSLELPLLQLLFAGDLPGTPSGLSFAELKNQHSSLMSVLKWAA